MTTRTVPLNTKAERRRIDWLHAPTKPYAVTVRGLGTVHTQTIDACCDAEARVEARAIAKCVMGEVLSITTEA